MKQNSKTQNVTRLKNTKCDKTQKTENMTKLKKNKFKFDKTHNSKC